MGDHIQASLDGQRLLDHRDDPHTRGCHRSAGSVGPSLLLHRIAASLSLPLKATMTQEILTRTPYRYAVGLMIESDKASEQVRNGQPCGGSFNSRKGFTGSVYWSNVRFTTPSKA